MVLREDLIGNLLNRSPLLSSKTRSFVWANSQEEVRYEGSPVKAPPPSRRIMPPTPQQKLASVD